MKKESQRVRRRIRRDKEKSEKVKGERGFKEYGEAPNYQKARVMSRVRYHT